MENQIMVVLLLIPPILHLQNLCFCIKLVGTLFIWLFCIVPFVLRKVERWVDQMPFSAAELEAAESYPHWIKVYLPSAPSKPIDPPPAVTTHTFKRAMITIAKNMEEKAQLDEKRVKDIGLFEGCPQQPRPRISATVVSNAGSTDNCDYWSSPPKKFFMRDTLNFPKLDMKTQQQTQMVARRVENARKNFDAFREYV